MSISKQESLNDEYHLKLLSQTYVKLDKSDDDYFKKGVSPSSFLSGNKIQLMDLKRDIKEDVEDFQDDDKKDYDQEEEQEEEDEDEDIEVVKKIKNKSKSVFIPIQKATLDTPTELDKETVLIYFHRIMKKSENFNILRKDMTNEKIQMMVEDFFNQNKKILESFPNRKKFVKDEVSKVLTHFRNSGKIPKKVSQEEPIKKPSSSVSLSKLPELEGFGNHKQHKGGASAFKFDGNKPKASFYKPKTEETEVVLKDERLIFTDNPDFYKQKKEEKKEEQVEQQEQVVIIQNPILQIFNKALKKAQKFKNNEIGKGDGKKKIMLIPFHKKNSTESYVCKICDNGGHCLQYCPFGGECKRCKISGLGCNKTKCDPLEIRNLIAKFFLDEYVEEFDFELPSAPKGSSFYKTDEPKSIIEEYDVINLYSITNSEYIYKILHKLIEEKNKDENKSKLEQLDHELPIDDFNQFPSLISSSPSSLMFSTQYNDENEEDDDVDED